MKYLVDLRTLIAHAFTEDKDHKHADSFFSKAEKEDAEVFVGEFVILEAEAVFLAKRVDVSLEEWLHFVTDLIESPAIGKIPINTAIYDTHAKLYKGFGGRLGYFDSYHGATAKVTGVPLVTSDEQILSTPDIPAKDLRKF